MKSGIYKIVNNITLNIYIGSTSNLKQRKTDHFSSLRGNNHCNKKLQLEFNNYGFKNFEFIIVEYCEIEKLIETEQKYFDELKPTLNCTLIAGKNFRLGQKMTISQRLKISERQKKQVVSDKTKQKLREHNLGKKHSEETRQKLSIISTLKWKQPEYKKKIRDKHQNWISNNKEGVLLRNLKIKEAYQKNTERQIDLKERMSKKVVQKTIGGEIVNFFNSITEATNFLGKKNTEQISLCCRNKAKTAYKFKWEFLK